MISNVLKERDIDRCTAEEWLLHYQSRKSQYYSDLNYVTESSGMPEVFVKMGPGNIVMQKVVSLADLEHAEKWLLVIEGVQDTLGPKKRLFLDLRRKAAGLNKTVRGQVVWRTYVQSHYAEIMAKEHGTTKDIFWLHDNTIGKWWNEIVEMVMYVALKKGCL